MKYLVRSGSGYVRDIVSTSPVMISDRKFAKVFDGIAQAEKAASSVNRCGLHAVVEVFSEESEE